MSPCLVTLVIILVQFEGAVFVVLGSLQVTFVDDLELIWVSLCGQFEDTLGEI